MWEAVREGNRPCLADSCGHIERRRATERSRTAPLALSSRCCAPVAKVGHRLSATVSAGFRFGGQRLPFAYCCRAAASAVVGVGTVRTCKHELHDPAPNDTNDAEWATSTAEQVRTAGAATTAVDLPSGSSETGHGWLKRMSMSAMPQTAGRTQCLR